ncbi:protein dennd6a-like isoform x1 [Plakobranchus ocellatus]|uniref:Protein dennd6a-like isoform x1 n=1 Tax=Plakobranchus ocellatus TaxID=259542 RepID=A0AAV4DJT0_9GAST|nr:protein dennd6a-like isoform x1 [Plakobranchus ocellatus]
MLDSLSAPIEWLIIPISSPMPASSKPERQPPTRSQRKLAFFQNPEVEEPTELKQPILDLPKAAVVLWGRSIQKHKIRFTTMLNEGESKVFNKLDEIEHSGPNMVVIKEDYKSWCQRQTVYTPLDYDLLHKHIQPIYDRLASLEPLRRCEIKATQNPGESFHHSVWLRCSEKNFHILRRVECALISAAAEQKCGATALSKIKTTFRLEEEQERYCKSVLYYLVHLNKRFDTLKITFPERGHSYMECDRDLALFNKKVDAEVPSDWMEEFGKARTNPLPYNVICASLEDFFAMTNFLKPGPKINATEGIALYNRDKYVRGVKCHDHPHANYIMQ